MDMVSKWPDWEAESSPTLADLRILPIVALAFAAVRFGLDKLIFEVRSSFTLCLEFSLLDWELRLCICGGQNLGRRVIAGYTESSKASPEVKEKQLVKFKESSWKCVYYLTAEIFALAVSCHEPWFTDTKYFWTGPGDLQWPDQMIKYARSSSCMFCWDWWCINWLKKKVRYILMSISLFVHFHAGSSWRLCMDLRAGSTCTVSSRSYFGRHGVQILLSACHTMLSRWHW